MSGDPEQAYFADGITEDIITALSKNRWLAVIARNTSFAYRGKSVDIRRLAGELGAKYVVEGSVRRAGERIRVTAQLIDTDTGNHLWAERYDRKLEDIFDVQDEITDTIAARVEPEVGAAERERVARGPRTDLRAWDHYHLGVAHFYKFTAADNLEAQRLLQVSRELDPNFGEAHAWWAYAVTLGMVYWDTEPDSPLLDEALAATNLALELDDQNAVFYALKARVQLARREYTSALAENEMAVKLNPTFAAAYCGLGDSLCYEGRYDEAIGQFEKAVALSPNNPQRWAFLTYGAMAFIFKQDFESALIWAAKASEVPNCQYWTTAHSAVALAYLERQDEAQRTVARLLVEKPGFNCKFAKRKLFYLRRPEQMELYLEGLRLAGVPA
ncbi:MAG: tetratricopeptide repeat protein, partial [Alphaproteobacteria bacterium]